MAKYSQTRLNVFQYVVVTAEREVQVQAERGATRSRPDLRGQQNVRS